MHFAKPDASHFIHSFLFPFFSFPRSSLSCQNLASLAFVLFSLFLAVNKPKTKKNQKCIEMLRVANVCLWSSQLQLTRQNSTILTSGRGLSGKVMPPSKESHFLAFRIYLRYMQLYAFCKIMRNIFLSRRDSQT